MVFIQIYTSAQNQLRFPFRDWQRGAQINQDLDSQLQQAEPDSLTIPAL